MSSQEPIRIDPIGRVESALTELADAPRQADEDAPPAWLVIEPRYREALAGVVAGADLVVLTWLDRGRRDVLVTRPRNDPERAQTGVFATRSPHRPNPIGLHRVRVIEVDGTRVRVDHLEALDGTPVIDIKPVLGPVPGR